MRLSQGDPMCRAAQVTCRDGGDGERSNEEEGCLCHFVEVAARIAGGISSERLATRRVPLIPPRFTVAHFRAGVS